jgi:hypothetical protein
MFAQTLSIKGQVVSKQSPIEYANVVLKNSDSSFVTGGITDRQGRFELENLYAGHYVLNISSVGYKNLNTTLPAFNKSMDLGKIVLDSASIILGEVVIKSLHIINQADKKIILPTAYQIKASINGIDLLRQMNLSRLQVDPMRNTITSSQKGDVQLRINGTKAEIQEIRALRPEDIQRVEYHEDPEMRYGENVAVVIDYITKRLTSGGYIGIDTQNSPFTGWGDNGINAKFNSKKAEYGFNYWGEYRYFNGYWRKNLETFNFKDGTSFVRKEEGIPNEYDENHHYINAYYNYQEGDKWFFNANLYDVFDGSKVNCESLLYPENDRNNNVNMLDISKNINNRPSIDFYFQRNYSNRKKLILDVVGTYIDSYNRRNYAETKDTENLTDIYSKINGNKYSAIVEAIYERGIGKKDKLSFGTYYYQAYSNNQYLGTITTLTNLREGKSSTYMEYMGSLGKINYSVGSHLAYYWFRQENADYNKILFFPKVKLKYNFSDYSYIRLTSELSYILPNLSELSNAEQLIDSLQMRRGNPNLKEERSYNNNLYYEWRKGLFTSGINLFYQYLNKPIMEATLRENDKFVRTTMNQRSWQFVNPELQLQLGPIKNILNLAFTTGMNYFNSRGLDYDYNYKNWYYMFDVTTNYKNFTAMFHIQNHRNYFYGETLNYGENYHLLGLKYKKKDLSVGLMVLNPFVGKNSYNRPSENFNKYAPSRSTWYLRESSQLYVVTLSWNLSFGRKYNAVQKQLNNSDTDAGTLKSGK